MIQEKNRNFSKNTHSFIGFHVTEFPPELKNTVPAFHLTLAASNLVLWLVFYVSPFVDKLLFMTSVCLTIYASPLAVRCTWWMSINVKHIDKYNFYFWQNYSKPPGGTVVKNLLANAGDPGDSGSIPGLGKDP